MTTRIRIILVGVASVVVIVLGLLVAGAVHFRQRMAEPLMERVGGTRLVYEVDVEKSPPGSFQPEDLAAVLQRRVDLMRGGITVTLLEPSRVQLDVPRVGGRTPEEHARAVEEIKETLAAVGSLEFRILANSTDDKEGIEAAQFFFLRAKNPGAEEKRLEELARLHLPPPPVAGGQTFDVQLDGATHQHSYSWVELGRPPLKTFGLRPEDRNDPRWKEAERVRGFREAFHVPGSGGFLFSRKAINSAAFPEPKEFEYFLLVRNSEAGAAVTGRCLDHVHPTQMRGNLGVAFHMNPEGARLLGELTRRNRPTGDTHRHIAMILDGVLESAPSLNAVITTDGMIEGEFSQDEVDRYVRVMTAGQMPAVLKPVPVRELEVEATKGRWW